MPSLDDLAHVLRPPAGDPAGAIVLIHGAASTEHDLVPLLDVIDDKARLAAAFPRGTLQLPPGVGYHWYVDREPGYPQRDTFEGSLTILSGWLDALGEQTGVPPERTILGGFDQGAAMAWALALAPDRPRPAGVLAMSGFIPRVSGFEPDNSKLSGLPVAITHGDKDERVPISLARGARERVEEAGAQVLYHETDAPHTLDMRVIPGLIAWVGERIRAAQAG